MKRLFQKSCATVSAREHNTLSEAEYAQQKRYRTMRVSGCAATKKSLGFRADLIEALTAQCG
jgi:hypothetical protein